MSTFTTLASLLAMFDREKRPDLFGPRTRGSISEIGLTELSDRPATEFTPPPGAAFGPCRYFRVEAHEIHGRLGAVAYRDLVPTLKTQVRIRDAGEDHGLELFVDRPRRDSGLVPVDHVTVILGPADENDPTLVVYTWHPGSPLAPLAGGANLADVAVKLHNG